MKNIFTLLLVLLPFLVFSQVQMASHNETKPISALNQKKWQYDGIFGGFAPKQEILEKRTQSTKHFQKDNGDIVAQIGGNYHYQDENKQWQDIDFTITKSNADGFAYSNTTNSIKTYFPETAGNKGISIRDKSMDITIWKNPELLILDKDKNIIQRESSLNNAAQVNDNIARYQSFNGVVDEMKIIDNGIENNIIINSFQNQWTNLSGAKTISFKQFVELPKGVKILNSKGDIKNNDFTDELIGLQFADGKTLYLNPLVVFDAKGNKEDAQLFFGLEDKNKIPADIKAKAKSFYKGSYTIKFVENGIEIYSDVSLDWLQQAQYPVTIDPTWTIGSTASGNFYGPLSHWYGFQRHASLYLQSEISGYGTITQVEYYKTGTEVARTKPTKVYMRSITGTTITSTDAWNSATYTGTGATACYDGNTTQDATASWKAIPLSTSHNYTSGNLLVMLYDAFGASGGFQQMAQASATGLQTCKRQDTSDPGDATAMGTDSYRTTIRITYSVAEMKVPSSGSNSYTTCSGHLYDNGGSAGAYAASSNGYTTLYPGAAGNMVQLTGTYYTEGSYDHVYIYNGVGTGGTQLFDGSTSALTSIGTITSTDASGALTVKFTSDGSVQNSGFDFTISCVNPCPVTPGTATLTNPTCGSTYVFSLSGNSGTISDWEYSWTSAAGPWTTWGQGNVSSVTWGGSAGLYVRARVTNGSCNVWSNVVGPTAAPVVAPTPGTVSASNPVCGSPGTWNFTLSGMSGGTVQEWEYSWVSASGPWTNWGGGGSSTYTWGPGGSAGLYVRCRIVNGGCTAWTPAWGPTAVYSNSVAPTGITGSNAICFGGSTTLSVSGGSLGAGANWYWYSGSCGGTYVGSGASITVSPTSATTYYVLASGTCNTTTCASITVTIGAPGTVSTTSMPAGTSVTTTPATPGAALGLSGGLTYSYTNASWPTCVNWGMPTTVAAVNLYNTLPPNNNCTFNNLVFDAVNGETNLAGGKACFTGTYNYYCINTSGSYHSNDCRIRLRVVVTKADGVTAIPFTLIGSNLVLQAKENFIVKAYIEGYAYWDLSGCLWSGTNYYDTYGVNGWTGVVDIFNSLNTDPNSSICTQFSPEWYTINSSASASSNSPVCQGSTINLTSSSTLGSGCHENWTGPNGFSSTTQSPSITNAQPANAGTYTVVIKDGKVCYGSASTIVAVNTPIGNPATYGNGVWNVYGYSGGNLDLAGSIYKGYYTESSLSYNTLDRWGTEGSPSDASGWQGCYVPVDNHIIASKRTNFTCGYYQLDMPNHDDDVRLYIDGALVWSHEPGCCDSHTNIWTGYLTPTSTIEVRHLEGVGGSHQSLTFVPVGTSTSTVPTGVSITDNNTCNGTSKTLTITGGVLANGATWHWYTGSCGGTSVGSGAIISVNPAAGSSTTYYVRAEGTCNTTGCVNGTVNVLAKPGITSATAAANPICANTTTTLTANGVSGAGTTVTWWSGTGGTGTNYGTGTTKTVGPGTYYARVTGTCTPAVEASVTVSSNALPTAAPAFLANPICSGSSTTLSANAVAGSGSISNYAWSSGIVGNNASGSVSAAGTYTVTVTNSNGCTVAATSPALVLNPLPAALILTGSTICTSPGGNGTITSTTSVSGINYQLYNSGGTAVQSAKAGTGSGLTWSSLPAGNGYYAVATHATTSCLSVNSNAVNVATNANPTAAPTFSSNPICSGITTTLSANAVANSGSITTYAWSSTLGNVASGTVSAAGTYTVTVTNSYGCTVAASSPTLTLTTPAITGITNGDYVWSGNTSTNWETASNWLIYDGTNYSTALSIPDNTKNVFLRAYSPCASNLSNTATSSTVSCHNLTIETGLTLGNTSQLSVSGDWNNNGTFNPGTGTVTFNGTAQQEIKAGLSAFNNVTFSNSTAGITDIRISSPITINGKATFANGVVYYSGTGSLSFGALATSNIGNANSYVNGIVSKTGTSAFTFAVGDGANWGPCAIEVPLSASTITAQYIHSAGPSNNWSTAYMCPSSGMHHTSGVEHWELTSNGDHPAVTLYWNSAASGILDLPDLTVAHYEGACWENKGGTVSGTSTTSLGSITSGAFTSYSPITFGTKSKNNPLPVDLVYFTAKCDNSTSILTWQTVSETNNDFYIIEKSKDMTNFFEIGRVDGAGNSNTPLSYSFIDNNLFSGDNYYRLKQFDYDGKTTTYDAVTVNCDRESSTTPTMIAYPNPFTDELNVIIENLNENTFVLEIFDDLGRVVYSKEFSSNEAIFHTTINLKDLRPAVYNLRSKSDGNVMNLKVVKK